MSSQGEAARPRRRAGHAKRRRLTTRLVTALLIVHVAIVFETERVMGRTEFFPFASFSLFSRVPNVVEDCGVRVLSLDGQPVGDDVWFEHSPKLFPAAHDHHAVVAIHRLGDLIRATGPDEPGVTAMRRWLEQNWLRRRGGGEMRYEVVLRRFDPMERWRHGTLIESRRLGTFSTTRPAAAASKAAS